MITVTGGTKQQRKLVKEIADFCATKFMPRMKTLEVNIELKKLDDAFGYCMSESNREFELEIAKNTDLRTLLTTVAHEMVHVKQYARGELFENVRLGMHRWQGKYLKKDPDYYDQPWEIEAHGREAGLFIQFVEKFGYSKCKWAQALEQLS